jgi:putative protease
LAPAGGRDALYAALANGADAVYLGLSDMNARRGAENFTLESLAEATHWAHLSGARVYLTANTLVLPDEMTDALGLVADAWEAGVDAVIVQDLGLMTLLARQMPEVRIHASTQVNAHDSAMLDVLQSLGCERITLAREVALPDITRFCARPAGPEIEVFVHGAICFCYSGQCLMSSMIGGRSANRGVCAQPCRLPYKLVDADDEVADAPGDYLLSPKDLAGIEMLSALVTAGVSSLKIEGRMKSPEYVALVTGVYRSALDRAFADPEGFSVTLSESEILEEAFSRGFTDGYLRGKPSRDMMSYGRPNNRGVPLGRVTSVDEGSVTISLDRSLSADDRVEFWTRSGRFAQVAGKLQVDGRNLVRAESGDRVTLHPEKRARLGDRVFRVANADLLSAARRSFTGHGDGGVARVDLHVTVRVGEPLSVVATSGGATAAGIGPVVETARTRPVTASDVVEHTAGRLGGSGYTAGEVEVDLDAAAGIGFSSLHAARRDAVAALDAARLAGWADRRIDESARTAELPRAGRRDPNTNTSLVVFAARAADASALLEAGADVVLVDEGEPTPGLAARVGALLPRIATDAEFPHVVRRGRASSVALSANIGVVSALAGSDDGPSLHSGAGANAMNPWAAEVLSELGANVVWLSEELSGKQVASVANASPAPVGVMVLGRTELMVAENCVLAAIGPCDRRCGKCERRDADWELVDRKGYRFPVYTDTRGRAHVFNSVPLDLSRALPEIVEGGVSFVGADVRLMTPFNAQGLVRAFRRKLTLAIAGREVPDERLVEPATAGHFFRGVK